MAVKQIVHEASKTSKTTTKHKSGGCTSKVSETRSTRGFVDRRSGNQGFKEQVKYESFVEVNDKIKGSTTEFQTQVKFTKTTTYHNTQNKITGGGSSGGSKGSGGGNSGGNKVSGGGNSGGNKGSGGSKGSGGGKSGGSKGSGGGKSGGN